METLKRIVAFVRRGTTGAFKAITALMRRGTMRMITMVIVLGLIATLSAIFYFINIWSASVCFLGLMIWFILSIKIVGPVEMAVKVYFGKPVAVCDSGFVLVLFAFGMTYLKRYSKKIYNLKYEKIEVITKAGEFDGILYGALKVGVDAAVYLNFPRFDTKLQDKETTHPLIKILRAGVPTIDEELKDWTQEAVENALRLAYGQITWRQATQEMEEINKKATEVFKNTDGALLRAGFRDKGIKLVVMKVHLPREVEIALTKPEITRLEAEAAVKDAEAQAIDRVETILYTMARSRNVGIDVIKTEIGTNPELQRELLNYAKKIHSQLEKADRGAFFEFSAPGKSGTEKGVLDALALFLRGVPKGKGDGGSTSAGEKGGGGATSTGNSALRKKKEKKRIEDMTDEELNALSTKEVESLLDEDEDEEEEEKEKK